MWWGGGSFGPTIHKEIRSFPTSTSALDAPRPGHVDATLDQRLVGHTVVIFAHLVYRRPYQKTPFGTNETGPRSRIHWLLASAALEQSTSHKVWRRCVRAAPPLPCWCAGARAAHFLPAHACPSSPPPKAYRGSARRRRGGGAVSLGASARARPCGAAPPPLRALPHASLRCGRTVAGGTGAVSGLCHALVE